MKELVDALSKNLDIDKKQATGGAAILFKAARDRLGEPQFNSLVKGLQGVDELIQKAPDSGSVGRLFGGFASALGGGNAAVLAGIVAGFGRLGLDTEHAKAFVPVILEFLRAKVGVEKTNQIERTIRSLW